MIKFDFQFRTLQGQCDVFSHAERQESQDGEDERLHTNNLAYPDDHIRNSATDSGFRSLAGFWMEKLHRALTLFRLYDLLSISILECHE